MKIILRRLIGIGAGLAILAGTPLTALAVTPAQQLVLNALPPILVSLNAGVSSIATARAQDAIALNQARSQLSNILLQLQQSPTQATANALSANLSAVAVQVNAIAVRRAQENAALAQLQIVLGQLAAWLRSL
jgi:hypothetical protein